MRGESAVTSIRELVKNCWIRDGSASIPTTQYAVKERQLSARRRMECSRLLVITGLNTLSSKFPWVPASEMAVSLPITCTHTMVIASLWVGLTFPGMIEEPGSLAGRISSPRPQRGPEPSQRISLAIFISEQARVFNAPLAMTRGSSLARAANLLGAETNGRLV